MLALWDGGGGWTTWIVEAAGSPRFCLKLPGSLLNWTLARPSKFFVARPGGSNFAGLGKKFNHVSKKMAPAEGSLWLAVKVVSGSRVLFGSKIINCLEYESFGQLLSRLENESFAERQVQGIIITELGTSHQSPLKFALIPTWSAILTNKCVRQV